MRILCTGAAGFIGSHLGDALWREHNFFGFDNFLTGKRENWPDAEEIDIVDRQRWQRRGWWNCDRDRWRELRRLAMRRLGRGGCGG